MDQNAIFFYYLEFGSANIFFSLSYVYYVCFVPGSVPCAGNTRMTGYLWLPNAINSSGKGDKLKENISMQFNQCYVQGVADTVSCLPSKHSLFIVNRTLILFKMKVCPAKLQVSRVLLF